VQKGPNVQQETKESEREEEEEEGKKKRSKKQNNGTKTISAKKKKICGTRPTGAWATYYSVVIAQVKTCHENKHRHRRVSEAQV
jgi:hypothetical protein